ncbi:hypothetical protein [Chitinophaga sp. XS-30]|uniref:hypothetical protein n=1 Tax=Chitinophaga sp. XS-30 TaxID=2604421 RepID=UPI0011DE00E4|nr:hypothetical protein [Chitinophaga sp. XS-30]QEH42203.1 hypothetical protein FW415_15505 [Chitinophaga sp. XS-30]
MYHLAKLFIVAAIFTSGCTSMGEKGDKKQPVMNKVENDSLFKQLMILTNSKIPSEKQNDSLAFLILPLNNSCPSCRDKTIDSISRHISSLKSKHYIIISANDGIKNMRATFTKNDRKIPSAPGRVFLDSMDLAYKFDLYASNPSMFYTAGGKVYKSVYALPESIKQDLQEFFSGFRSK